MSSFLERVEKNKSFFELVEKMRDRQKEYFRTRDRNVLSESKALERSVDKMIKDFREKENNNQSELFE